MWRSQRTASNSRAAPPANSDSITERSAWREAVRSVVAFDVTKIDAGFAARCTVGVATPFVIAALAGSLTAGVAAATGALGTGFASLQGVYRTRAATMLYTAVGMGLATLLGGLTGGSAVASVLVTAAFGYAYGVIASLGPAATVIGVQSTVALVVFGHLGLGLPQTLEQSAFVLAGGVLQTILLVIVWPLGRYAVERQNLAGAYHRLAQDARAVALGQPYFPDASAILTVRATLADPRPFARRGDVAFFAALLDEAERLRAGLATLAHIGDPQMRPVVEACASALDAIATGLHDGRAPHEDASVWDVIEAHERAVERPEISALLGRVRAAWRTATAPGSARSGANGRSASHAFPTVRDTLATLRANIGIASPFGRLAIRLAVTLGTADGLARGFAIERGYWMILTAALLLKPDFTTTFARGFARVAGTLAGVALAGGIVLALHPLGHADIVLCAVFAGLGYLTFNANYGVFTATITAYVVFAFSILGQSDRVAISERLVSTLYGSALAGLATIIWPTWEGGRAREGLARLIDADRTYVDALFELYVRGGATQRGAVDNAQTAAWMARATAEASVDRLLMEPARARTIDGDSALGMLAASRRLAIALLSLNARSRTAPQIPPDALAPLRPVLDALLSRVVAQLREQPDAPVAPVAPLRPRFAQTRQALEAGGAAAVASLVTDLDALVDSANALADLAAKSTVPAVES